MRKECNKLVRDFIPEIIEREGKKPYVRVLKEEEMLLCLEGKLLEEVNEYIEDKSIEELADILEVIYALCEIKGVSREQLERTRAIKEIARGAFGERFFLESVEDQPSVRTEKEGKSGGELEIDFRRTIDEHIDDYVARNISPEIPSFDSPYDEKAYSLVGQNIKHNAEDKAVIETGDERQNETEGNDLFEEMKAKRNADYLAMIDNSMAEAEAGGFFAGVHEVLAENDYNKIDKAISEAEKEMQEGGESVDLDEAFEMLNKKYYE